MTPVNDALIPTGEIKDVWGTHFDLRKSRNLGESMKEVDGGGQAVLIFKIYFFRFAIFWGENKKKIINFFQGYDHNFVVSKSGKVDDEGRRFACRLEHQGSGRAIECWTNQPGMQFYTGEVNHFTLSIKVAEIQYRVEEYFILTFKYIF